MKATELWKKNAMPLERATYAYGSGPFRLETVPGASRLDWYTNHRVFSDDLEYPFHVKMAMACYEAQKAPSIWLDVTDAEPRLVLGYFAGRLNGYYVRNGVEVLPRRAMRGQLMDWKLCGIEFDKDGEIWLIFVNAVDGEAQKWKLTKDGMNPINEARIVMPDGRMFEYEYNVAENRATLREYREIGVCQTGGLSNAQITLREGSSDWLVRMIKIDEDGLIFVDEVET